MAAQSEPAALANKCVRFVIHPHMVVPRSFTQEISQLTHARVSTCNTYFLDGSREIQVTVYALQGPDATIQGSLKMLEGFFRDVDDQEVVKSIKFLLDESQAVHMVADKGKTVKQTLHTSGCAIMMFGKRRLPSSASSDDSLLVLQGTRESLIQAVTEIVPRLVKCPTFHQGLAISSVNTVFSGLPEHVLPLVMVGLPPKSLSQFKAVSKEWNLTISSKVFVEEHYRISVENKNIRVVLWNDPPAALMSSFLDYEARQVHGNSCWRISHLPSVSFDLRMPGDDACICKGVVCFFGYQFLVWNPTTGHYTTLAAEKNYSLYGFGYNSVEHGFQIVFLERDSPTFNIYSVRVRLCQTLPLPACLAGKSFHKRGVYLNGFIHWLEIKSSGMSPKAIVMSLNLKAVTFEDIVALPDYDIESWPEHLGILEGKLSFVLKNNKDVSVIDRNIMELGSGGWNRLELGFRWSYTSEGLLDERPLCISRCKGLLVFRTGETSMSGYYIMYDRLGEIRWRKPWMVPVVYNESLYSPF